MRLNPWGFCYLFTLKMSDRKNLDNKKWSKQLVSFFFNKAAVKLEAWILNERANTLLCYTILKYWCLNIYLV